MASFADIAGGAGQAVSGIGGLISGITQAARGRNWYKGLAEDQASIDYKYNQMAADAAQRREMENWHETFDATNAYNDPAAMRKRLEAAGMSKAAMFEGTVGQPSSAGEMGTGESGFNPRAQISGSDMNAFADNLQRGALVSAQIADLYSSAHLKDEQSVTQGSIRLLQEATANLHKANTKLAKSNVKLNGLRMVAQQLENAFNKDNYDNQLTIQGLDIARMSQNLEIAREELIYAQEKNRIFKATGMQQAVASYMQLAGQVSLYKAQQELMQHQGKMLDEQANMYNSLGQYYFSEATINKFMTEGFEYEYDGNTYYCPPIMESQAIGAYSVSRDQLEDWLHYYDLFLSNMWQRLMPKVGIGISSGSHSHVTYKVK